VIFHQAKIRDIFTLYVQVHHLFSMSSNHTRIARMSSLHGDQVCHRGGPAWQAPDLSTMKEEERLHHPQKLLAARLLGGDWYRCSTRAHRMPCIKCRHRDSGHLRLKLQVSVRLRDCYMHNSLHACTTKYSCRLFWTRGQTHGFYTQAHNLEIAEILS